jgi:DNA-binding NarL/FixJ family response regulator
MSRLACVRRDFCPLRSTVLTTYAGRMKNHPSLTVLIIDENATISRLLAGSLSLIPGIRVIGETANAMLGAELAHQLRPDVILADFRRTGPPRAETYRWLCRLSPASRVVAHTSYLPNGDERALREAGVSRCVLKGSSVKELAEQILDLARPNGRPSITE